MLFNSIEFLVFLPIVYGLYLVLNHKGQNRLLLVASYVFYGAWDYRFLLLLAGSTVIDFFASYKIVNSATPKRWLALSLFANLSFLGSFKYFDFFAQSFADLVSLFGFQADPLLLNLVLPVGISFYTFQTMSYSIDVYRKKLKPANNFWDFALYVSFFPQLVAGPIERAERFLPQVENPRKIDVDKIRGGLWLIILGFFQKVYIADNLAPFVDTVFAEDRPTNGILALLGIYAFAFQIYGDFAGYSNIARGIARLMGFELMVNFHAPYLATSPSDFWRRWHISLSSWLRDYLYIPLGGNRFGTFKTYRNLVITMLLGGLWHGAAWTYILWGAYQGTILVVARLASDWTKRLPRFGPNWIRKTLIISFMFHVTCLGWLIFRAHSVGQIGGFLEAILTDFKYVSGIGIGNIALIVKVSFVLVLVDLSCWYKNDTDRPLHWPFVMRVALFLILILSTLIAGNFGYNEFIYFQF